MVSNFDVLVAEFFDLNVSIADESMKNRRNPTKLAFLRERRVTVMKRLINFGKNHILFSVEGKKLDGSDFKTYLIDVKEEEIPAIIRFQEKGKVYPNLTITKLL